MKAFIAVIFTIFIVSCDYNHQKGDSSIAPSGPIPNEKLNSPDYATVSAVVLKDRCVRCHSAAGGMKGDLDLEGYEKVKAEISEIEFHVFEKRDMPPRGKLTPLEERTLRLWIDQGAPLKTGCDPAIDPTFQCTPLTFANMSLRILGPKCLECHSAANPQGGLDVGNLADFKSKVGVVFDRVFVKKDMPQLPVKPLNIDERRALLNWIDLGMPE